MGAAATRSRVELFGMPLDVGLTPDAAVAAIEQDAPLVSYLNPYAWKVARLLDDYPGNLARFDLLTCDGVGVRQAVRRVLDMSTAIISLDYSGIARDYLAAWARRQGSLALVGGRAPQVQAAAARLRADYPGLRVVHAFSGFGEDPARAIEAICRDRTDLVLAGMGMGLQERYLLELRDRGWNGCGIAVGGFFDKLADPGKEYPAWATRHNVRFLARILDEPGKFLKRYTIDYTPFMKCFIKSYLPGRHRHASAPGRDPGE